MLFLLLLFATPSGTQDEDSPEDVKAVTGQNQDSIFCIDVEDIANEHINIVLDTIWASGASCVRVYAFWHHIEPEAPDAVYASAAWGSWTGKHRYYWQHLDTIVDGARERDMSVYIVNMWAPQWANSSNPSCNPFTGPDLSCGNVIRNSNWYADFVYNEVTHFRGRVQYFGAWNEPNDGHFFNGPRDSTYLNVFMATYALPAHEALKAANPDAKLVGPELSMGTGIPNGNARWDDAWLEPILKYFPGTFDVLSVHNHSDSHEDAKAKAEKVRQLIMRYDFGREFWMTEYGVNTCEVSEEEQARQMRLVYIDTMNRSSWWKKTFYYTYADNDGETCGAGLHTAFDRGFSPRPAYMEYKILTGK